jgi:hypothetical protein
MNLAWFLMTCPAPEFKDAHRSVRLMRAVTGRSRPVQNAWGVLGAASYYCDDLPGAAERLEKARRLSPQNFGIWDYYMAMIHWRQGRNDDARACFDRAQRWIKANGAKQLQQRVRRESAAVLGLDVGVEANAPAEARSQRAPTAN